MVDWFMGRLGKATCTVQLISKYLFGVFNTFKNKQKQIDLRYRSSEGEFFRSFFGGRIEDTKKTFRN